MKFNDNGTFSVDIEGQTYSLSRPNLGQLWEYIELREQLTADVTEFIEAKAAELEQMEDKEAESELREILGDRTLVFRMTSEPWLRKAFEEFGSKPLPENLDKAPSEFADPALPNTLIRFWREVPLASGRPRG